MCATQLNRVLACFAALVVGPAGIVTPWTHAQQSSKHGRQVILIGFENYQSLPANKYCSQDLTLLEKSFRDSTDVDIAAILTESDSLPNPIGTPQFLSQLKTVLSNANRKSLNTLLVYINAHCVRDSRGDPSIALPDAKPNSDHAKVPIAGINKLLSDVAPAANVMVLLDCKKRYTDSDDELLTNGEVVAAFDGGGPICVLAASGKSMESQRHPKKQNGLFAVCIGDALTGSNDANDDGEIDVGELYRLLFVSMQKQALSRAPQKPRLRVFGKFNKQATVALYRSQDSTIEEVRLQNTESSSGAVVRIRVDEVESKIQPSATEAFLLDQNDSLEFYTGYGSAKGKWQPVLRLSERTKEFRLVPQIDGSKKWVVGFTNSIGMKMTLVPAGQFSMGQRAADLSFLRSLNLAPTDYTLTLKAERPLHKVRIRRPFYMGSHEVSKRAFRQFVNRKGYVTDAVRTKRTSKGFADGAGNFVDMPGLSWQRASMPQGEDHPVVHVTWDDTDRFCKWLTYNEGVSYSLPTEAQWEYAARAGTDTVFWNGNDDQRLVEIGNVRDVSLLRRFPTWISRIRRSDGHVHTSPIGSFKPNPFGLYDTLGNVWEWCADRYSEDYYANSPLSDPPGPFNGSGRVYRGGCFY